MDTMAISAPAIYWAPAGLVRALLMALGIALVLSAAISDPFENDGSNRCRPFTIGVSAIGGPDPIGRCSRFHSGARLSLDRHLEPGLLLGESESRL